MRASSPEQQPEKTKRNNVALFLSFLHGELDSGFGRYEEIERAYKQLQSQFADIKMPDIFVATARKSARIVVDNAARDKVELKLNMLARGIHEELLRRIRENNPVIAESRIQAVSAAMNGLYKIMLEVIADMNIQQRRGLGSHRGLSGKEGDMGPALGLDTLQEVFRAGIRAVEVDVHADRDGIPVVAHDRRTRVDGGGKKGIAIASATLAELQNRNAKIDRTDAPLYGLEDLLKAFEPYKSSGHRINIEIKDPHATGALIQLIEKYQMEQNCFVSSQSPRVILDVHQKLPSVPVIFNAFILPQHVNSFFAKASDSVAPRVINAHRYAVGPLKDVILPNGVVLVGGSQVPEIDQPISAAFFRTLPEEIRAAVRNSNGYISICLPHTMVPVVGRLFRKNSALAKMKAMAKEDGIRVLTFTETKAETGALRPFHDFQYINEAENVLTKRRRDRRKT